MLIMSPILFFTFLIITFHLVNSNPSVIIVGAGAAGISAASRLYSNGITDIKILEAEDRIGGRVYSKWFDEAYVDLGAQWCHGNNNNIVYDLAKNLNILNKDDITPSLYHSSLSLIDEDFTENFLAIFDNIRGKNETVREQTFEQLVTKRYKEAIEKNWKNQTDKEMLAQDCFELLKKLLLHYDGAFSFRNLPANKDFERSEGHQNLGWNGLGYKTILNILMENLPIEENTLLNKQVVKINWEDAKKSGKVVVNCADATTYTADHVILTVSLGVLKERYETFFKPSLPNKKINAIKTLGIEAISKIFFYFPNKWWTESFKNAALAWSQNDLEKSAEGFSKGPEKDGKSWITDIVEIHTVPKNPNVLLAILCGEFIEDIEHTSERNIIDGFTYVLKRFLGNQYPNISSPERILRNNWYQNPHFRGTFSFQTIESRNLGESTATILSEPLYTLNDKPTLLFAGKPQIRLVTLQFMVPLKLDLEKPTG